MTLDNQTINHIFGVNESYQAPYELAKILQNKQQRESMFKLFIDQETDLSYDWFTNYFQEEQSDRKRKKQDFTPDGIAKIASGILGNCLKNADICAGTGGLTIKRWLANKDSNFYCEEFSDRAVPFLVFNLAIRNMNAIVCHGNSLTRQFEHIYKLTKSDQFSDIELVDQADFGQADTVIMNPPYSLPWNPIPEYASQGRFKDYGLAPKSKADYAFVLEGLSKLSDTGTMSVIVPHGVLFRGQAEGKIRTKLLENNYLDAVIGLPDNTFLNTSIPTAILVFKKNKLTNDVLFIDASKEYTKQNKYNVIEQKHVDKILQVYQSRQELDKFSNVVSFEEIKKNDFNLSIPRYVDTFEAEPVIPLDKVMSELQQCDKEIAQNQHDLAIMFNELIGTTPEAQEELDRFKSYFVNEGL